MYQRFTARSSGEKDAILLFAIFAERPVGVGAGKAPQFDIPRPSPRFRTGTAYSLRFAAARYVAYAG
jgi:hypothetical protein